MARRCRGGRSWPGCRVTRRCVCAMNSGLPLGSLLRWLREPGGVVAQHPDISISTAFRSEVPQTKKGRGGDRRHVVSTWGSNFEIHAEVVCSVRNLVPR